MMQSRSCFVLLVCLMALVLAGCGLTESSEEITLEDEGAICFSEVYWGGGDRADLQADEPLEIMVLFGECLVGGCNRTVDTSCSVEVDGDTVTITSTGIYEVVDPGRGGACTDDCGALTARCTVPALAEGSYTFVHGDDSYEVDVPGSEEESSCLGGEY